MRKLSLFSIFILLSVFAFAQPTGKWSTSGNATTTGDFIGTTNNFPLDFRTNNNQVMSLDANGNLSLKTLIGSGNRILITDGNGNISFLPQGTTGQFLQSNGSWSNLPAGATNFNINGNDLFTTNSGNFGIGTSSPSYKLDVFGDARISNNLYVGGGVVITNKVDASVEVKAGDIIVNNDLSVNGKSTFTGTLTSAQGIMFDNVSGIGFKQGPSAGTGTFTFGKTGSTAATACAAGPYAGMYYAVGGAFQIYDALNTTNPGLMNLQTWPGGSSIDASVNGQTGGGGLLLNYFCGNNTLINTGGNGGTVYLGKSVSSEQNVGIGSNYPNPNYDVNVGLNIYANNNNMDGIRINLWNGTTKAINLVHPSTGVSNFIVWQNGKTQIGYQTQKSPSPYTNAMLTVNGTTVSREVIVTLTNWADFVFDAEYKLKTPYEIEKFYLVNKHLEGVPSEKEVIENGVSLGEMNKVLLSKIEELTLLLVKQQKEIDGLKKIISK